ncbi:MAG: amidohydrolase [Acidobacteria bacterium]|nr:amidohydrolase [Acidobacteriota bacterium]
MEILDVHNHYYPPEYLELLKKGGSAITVDEDEDGNPRVHYPGDYNIVVKGHRDIDYRQDILDELGVTKQVITFTTPGVHVETPAIAAEWARLVNDCMGKIAKERSRHFSALATLPLNDPAAAVVELERAMKEHGLPGAMLFSNVNGVPLADERYFPLYQKADELGAVLQIHPEYPLGVEAMKKYWLMPLVGFLMDTTLATAHLVFAGVPERYPNIKWVLGHLGGAIPYLAERLDRGYEAFAECRANITKPPTEYLKHFYFDTVNFDPNALMCAVQFAGADHILAGSDYPHQIGSIQKMKTALGSLPLSEGDKALISGGNAKRVYGL